MIEKLYQAIENFVKKNNIPVKVYYRPPTYYCDEDRAMFTDIAIQSDKNKDLPDIAVLQYRNDQINAFIIRIWRSYHAKIWLLDETEQTLEIIDDAGKHKFSFKEAIQTLTDYKF